MSESVPQFQKGQYVYRVYPQLLSKTKFEVKRYVLLEWYPDSNRYQLGDSKRKESSSESGFIDRGINFYHSPKEAKQAFIKSHMEWAKSEMARLRKKIDEQKQYRETIRRLKHTQLPLRAYDDDWTPVDY